MLFIQTTVGDHRLEFGKGYDGLDSARCGYTQTWAQNTQEQEKDACVKAYPSPPMSGSLPPSSAGAPAASDPNRPRDNRPQTILQNVDRGMIHQQSTTEPRIPHAAAGPITQAYQAESPSSGPYGYQRQEPPPGRPLSYPQMLGPSLHQHQYIHPGSVSSTVGYPVTARPQTMEHPPHTSPKSQRKTKGHVASACVPCKKAHLR